MSKDTESKEELPKIPRRELYLRIQLLDYLFKRGHKVSKPLIHAVAHFTYGYGQALKEQGRTSTPAQKEEAK